MDFKTFYGLSMNPFAKGALPTKDAFQSNDLKALLNRLRYLVNVRGVGVFTASPEWESLTVSDASEKN